MTDHPPPYRPDSADLLRTVADFLTELGPRLDSGDRYTALVCTHILNMVRRELAGAPPAETGEAALAAAIRAGAHDGTWDETFEAVLTQVIGRVRMVKPEHLEANHR